MYYVLKNPTKIYVLNWLTVIFKRVHDLKTLRQVCLIEAHDAEVLYLDYTKYSDKTKLFASASRDRLIHVFNVNKVSY